jgi:hypothetical protein
VRTATCLRPVGGVMNPAGQRPAGDPLGSELYVYCRVCRDVFGPLGEWPRGCPASNCKGRSADLSEWRPGS